MSHLSNDSLRVTIYFNLHLYFSLRILTFHVCMYKYMYIPTLLIFIYSTNCDGFSKTYITGIYFNNVIPKFLVVTFSKVTCIAKGEARNVALQHNYSIMHTTLNHKNGV
jgi:hypothetical protein